MSRPHGSLELPGMTYSKWFRKSHRHLHDMLAHFWHAGTADTHGIGRLMMTHTPLNLVVFGSDWHDVVRMDDISVDSVVDFAQEQIRHDTSPLRSSPNPHN